MGRRVAVRRGSANVFADLGVADPGTHLVKARLVSQIQDAVDDRGLTQTEAARILGVGQPDVSRMLRGNFRDLSVERLMRFVQALGYDVDIVVREKGRRKARDTIHLPSSYAS